MDTYFAPAERAMSDELTQTLQIISQNPFVYELSDAVGGLLAVLNKHRQIVALNNELLKMLGVEDNGEVFGLRLGEAVQCVHAHEMPGGCGTSKFCSTCGAAIAMAASLTKNKATERTCAITIKRNNKRKDIFLRVHARPLCIETRQFVLLFLQDITQTQQWAALERVFFHDLGNIITGLVGTSTLMTMDIENTDPELIKDLHRLSTRLAKEVEMQRYLTNTEHASSISSFGNKTRVQEIYKELEIIFSHHRSTKGKQLTLLPQEIDRVFQIDISLLLRVLTNMVTNALEATQPGGEVRVWVQESQQEITWYVWNDKAIPQNLQNRIFQRNFTTKPEMGRGLGTYSMKLFGEEFLGGQVRFETSKAEGTVFSFCLPVRQPLTVM